MIGGAANDELKQACCWRNPR